MNMLRYAATNEDDPMVVLCEHARVNGLVRSGSQPTCYEVSG